MKALLIVEDDAALGEGLRIALQAPETELCLCRSLSAARDALKNREFDLMLLDVNLPDGSGLDFVRKLRQEGKTGLPVILLTANDTELDIVAGLESGADDYVTKPFDTRELLARITVWLRTQPRTAASSVLRCGELLLDTASHSVSVSEQPVKLTRTEYAILKLLMQNPTQVIAKSTMLERLSTDTPDCTENSLKVHISHLRKKLQDVNGADYITSVWGIGFQLNLTPES